MKNGQILIIKEQTKKEVLSQSEIPNIRMGWEEKQVHKLVSDEAHY